MSFLNKIKPYFYFTRNEKKGMSVLMILLLLIISLKILLPILISSDNITEPSFEIVQVKKSNAAAKPVDRTDVYSDLYQVNNQLDPELKVNPNIASYSDLLKIGLSKFAADNLIKYRYKGGRFNSISDLNKIYGVDTVQLFQRRNQIIFSQPGTSSEQKPDKKFKLELNTADSASLQFIPCIGPILALRIIKYRNLLGGFHSVYQLKEVYGIDSTCYHNLSENIQIDTSLIHKLNLNTCSESEFYNHPYISRYQARAIVKYRQYEGEFRSVYQLKQNYILSNADFQKATKYLYLGKD
jgi:competence protein ComEA